MKYLKITLGCILFCLLIFTSCISDAELTLPIEPSPLSAIEIETMKQGNLKIYIPKNAAQLSPEELSAYLNSLSSEALYQHMLTYKIMQFLRATGNIEKLYKDNPNHTFLTMDDLRKYAPEEFEKFQDFDLTQSNVATPRNGCDIVYSYCDGATLTQKIRCCYYTYVYPYGYYHWCIEEIDLSPNSSQCPCGNVQCAPNEYCDNGYCYPFDDHVECDPPCDPDEICIGFKCISAP